MRGVHTRIEGVHGAFVHSGLFSDHAPLLRPSEIKVVLGEGLGGFCSLAGPRAPPYAWCPRGTSPAPPLSFSVVLKPLQAGHAGRGGPAAHCRMTP